MPHRSRLVLIVMTIAVGATCALADDAAMAPQSADVTVTITNGTTGKPGTADRVEVREIGYAMRLLASADNVKGQIVFPNVELLSFRPYLATAIRNGVPYQARMNGQNFLDGEALTVYVFDETDDLDGVTITGLNAVLRRRGAGYELEYVMTIENKMRPQKTVSAAAVPVRMLMPAGVANLQGQVFRGPESEPITLQATADGFTGSAIALPPGGTRITATGFLAAAGKAHVDIACNLPVEAWSLLVSPQDLVVACAELNRNNDDEYPTYTRYRGAALAAGQRVPVDVNVAPGVGQATDVFAGADTGTTPAGALPSTGDDADGGFPWAVILGVSVALVAFGIWRRSR